ncbi:hypothetical protein [Pollutimonas bauzanensis]|uniref:Outer membrane protein beta-barrel domain-containing protein n=1 Tax=Pollutimonas bauzanensis TaxID=658167 RepID=A0A1M6B9E5_9BURK|nr:hypothetical protein [Pollutimonas bauzanensis]SHI45335.1 hypothetical protein SAMN04488135_12432 [Pollutimonas bauzanensis]
MSFKSKSFCAGALFTLLCAPALSQSLDASAADRDSRHGVYAKAGFLGAGLGYAYGLNRSFTLRADFTTIGSINRDFSAGAIDYSGKLKNDNASLYLDWFPVDNGFRLTGGLAWRDTELSGKANAVKLNGTTLQLGEGDSYTTKAKYRSLTPYIGIGYGLNVAQQKANTWGFVADLGVYYANKPRTSYAISGPTYDAARLSDPQRVDQAVNEQFDEFRDKVEKYKFIPAVYIGVSYYF